MELLVPPRERSVLLPLWKAAGATLGALPVLAAPFSVRPFFATVSAVETFVEQHYLGHIRPLVAAGACPELVKLLK